MLVDMPITPPNQPLGCPSSILVRPHSATRNVSGDTSVVLPRLPARGPATRSTATTLAAAVSSESPRIRPAVESGSTTESSPVKRVRAVSLITTVSSSTTPAMAVPPVSSLARAPSPKIQLVSTRPSNHPPAVPSSFSFNGYPVEVCFYLDRYICACSC